MKEQRTPVELVGLVVSLVLCFAAAGIGGWLTSLSINGWYRTLMMPSFAPPDWIFGPVWTALYLMMAVAAWLVWRERRVRPATVPLAIFAGQLILNIAWSGLFFALQSPGLAAGEVVLLWLAILATIIAFRRVSSFAATLLVPYLLWVSFATVLNFAIWRLNT
ncbi:MAG: tryptophan-rich sensory protein [Planctomycetaceae bacterium]|nr:tryptophan-rich sensory protein [Planctomycetaceae bacterium]